MVKKILYGKNKTRLFAELIILYVGLPLFFTLDFFSIPLLGVLVIMGLSTYIFLINDATFDKKSFISWKSFKKVKKSILLMFLVSATTMVAVIWFIDTDKLFILPKDNPLSLLSIVIIYPLFSVIPQGLAYRSLFFHRYASLFPKASFQIFASAVFFALGHLLYKDWLVVGLTFMAGLVYAYRYYKTRSLAISVVEHSLWGLWLFTCGLGTFFVSSMI